MPHELGKANEDQTLQVRLWSRIVKEAFKLHRKQGQETLDFSRGLLWALLMREKHNFPLYQTSGYGLQSLGKECLGSTFTRWVEAPFWISQQHMLNMSFAEHVLRRDWTQKQLELHLQWWTPTGQCCTHSAQKFYLDKSCGPSFAFMDGECFQSHWWPIWWIDRNGRRKIS